MPTATTHTIARRRKTYTNSDKYRIVCLIDDEIQKGFKAIDACRKHCILPSSYSRWKKNKDMLKASRNKKGGTKATLHPGFTSPLMSSLKDALLSFFKTYRDQGLPVSYQMLMGKASSESDDFKAKSYMAQYHSVKRFAVTNHLVIRTGTHESQKHPEAAQQDGKDFIIYIVPKIRQPNRHKEWTMNMDQTAVFHSMQGNKTLELEGVLTVNIRKSTGDTKRTTCCMFFTAGGTALTPMVVFKGKRGGRIEKKELGSFPDCAIYKVQETAWVDEELMLEWVDEVLAPHVAKAPAGVSPLLLLDSYKVHMTNKVVSKIQNLGVELEHIPGGCTGLCQPVDVGINKPFKNAMRKHWNQWMIEVGLQGGNMTKPPSRAEIAKWITESYYGMSLAVRKNAWLKTGYSYYPDETKAN